MLLRLYLTPDRPLGPGKIQILESIRKTGSISEAARGMKMSYRSAWLLVDSMNSQFKKPVVSTTLGMGVGGNMRHETRVKVRVPPTKSPWAGKETPAEERHEEAGPSPSQKAK